MNLCDSLRFSACSAVQCCPRCILNPVSVPNEPGVGHVVSDVPPGRKIWGIWVPTVWYCPGGTADTSPPIYRWDTGCHPIGSSLRDVRCSPPTFFPGACDVVSLVPEGRSILAQGLIPGNTMPLSSLVPEGRSMLSPNLLSRCV